MRLSNGENFYKKAITKLNPDFAIERMKSVRSSVANRLEELSRCDGNLEERQEITDAVSCLEFWERFRQKSGRQK